MGMANLFCTLQVQEWSLSLLCFVTPRAVVQRLMLPWPGSCLGSEHFTEVNCSLMSIFWLDYFLLAPEKMQQIRKRGGMDQAGVWLMFFCCYSLATALQRQPGAYIQPHTVSRGQCCWTEVQKSSKLGLRLPKTAKMKCWAWDFLSCCLSPEDGRIPKVCCLGLGTSTSSPSVAGIEAWKISFRFMGLGPLYLDSLCWTFMFSLF